MENERWKEEVMQSLQGMQKAEPSPFLFTRIQARIAKKYGRIPSWQLQLAAGALIVLLILNSVAMLRSRSMETTMAPNEYQLSGLQNY
jgi:hypothetical protein